MKLTTGIVALAITVGTAAAQNPATILQNTKNSLQDVAQQQTAASNAALQGSAAKPSAGTATKPGAAAPVKPATGSSQTAAKPTTVPVKVSAAAKPAVVPAKTAANSQATWKPASASASSSNVNVVPAKAAQAAAGSSAQPARAKPAPAVSPAPKVVPAKTSSAPLAQPGIKVVPTKAAPAPAAKPVVAASKGAVTTAPAKPALPAIDKTAAAKPEEKEKERKYSMTGKRDPFISPVVDRQGGSGCSTGKKCLDIEQIALHGVVKSENGMIAVVTNALNKAYFLRENDPVFNGYVLKINVDSIVFKQNFQDRLGKPFTKDVVKRITTPAV